MSEGSQNYTKAPIKEAVFDFQIRGDSSFSYDEQKEEKVTSIDDKKSLQDLKKKITQIHNEHQEEGWDGYGAKPVQNLDQALRFAKALFQESRLLIQGVDIIPENDGAICFEWFWSHSKCMYISIIGDQLIYNYRIGEEKGCGETNFAGKQMLFEKIKQNRLLAPS